MTFFTQAWWAFGQNARISSITISLRLTCAGRPLKEGRILMLLDTDVMGDVLRNYPPALVWMASMASSAAALPGLVALELLQGCTNLTEQRRVERELQRFALY